MMPAGETEGGSDGSSGASSSSGRTLVALNVGTVVWNRLIQKESHIV